MSTKKDQLKKGVRNLLEVFIQFDESPDETEANPDESITEDGVSQRAPQPKLPPREELIVGQRRSLRPQEKFMQIFLQKIMDADLPGLDFLEYHKATASLVKRGQTPKQAASSAFVSLTAMSPEVTVEHLLETGKHYIMVLQGLISANSADMDDRISTAQQEYNDATTAAEDQLKSFVNEREEIRKRLLEIEQGERDAEAAIEQAKRTFAEVKDAAETQRHDVEVAGRHYESVINMDLDELKLMQENSSESSKTN